MSKLSDSITFFRRNYSDVVGVDIGASGTKVVRIKRIHGVPTVTGVDILPAIELPEKDETPVTPCIVPKALKGRYAAISTSKGGGVLKLLTFPAHSGKTNDEHVLELMGLGEEHYRLGYETIFENRNEVRALAAALPETVLIKLCQLFPVGLPAPCSVELSGLASLTAYNHNMRGADNGDDGSVMVDFGHASTVVIFSNKNSLVLVRKIDFGSTTILKKLQSGLGVEADVALGILNDGSFDVTKMVHQAMEPFLQQLTISWDFVERRENIHIGKLFACGGGVGLHLWAQEVETATGQAPIRFDPFAGLSVQPGAFPDQFKGQEPRFSAAIGAALAMLKGS